MKKILQLNWLKWLPIISNIFFAILFRVKLNEYLNKKYVGYPLSWYNFFGDIEIVLVVSTICSFFIKNRWLKWLSVATGAIVFIAIDQNVGKFNPY